MKYKTIFLIVCFWIWAGQFFWERSFEATNASILWSGYAIGLCWLNKERIQ